MKTSEQTRQYTDGIDRRNKQGLFQIARTKREKDKTGTGVELLIDPLFAGPNQWPGTRCHWAMLHRDPRPSVNCSTADSISETPMQPDNCSQNLSRRVANLHDNIVFAKLEQKFFSQKCDKLEGQLQTQKGVNGERHTGATHRAEVIFDKTLSWDWQSEYAASSQLVS